MKIEDLKQVAVNNIAHLNITLKDAKALLAFLAYHDLEQVGELFIVPLPTQPFSSQSKPRIMLSEIEGPIPEDLALTWSAALKWKSGANTFGEIGGTLTQELGAIMTGLKSFGPALNVGVRDTIGGMTNWQYVPLPMRLDVEEVLWEACFGEPFTKPVDTSKDDPAMPDAPGFLGRKTLFPGVFELEPGDTTPVGTVKVAPDGLKYERLATTWRHVQ